ncbi:MAG: hypothetical protein JKY61_08975 [Planctomycetes bacterium]|nr:hypothetical protein [Planctomycetota bacterium]
MMGWFGFKVRITFVEGATGDTLGSTKLRADDLPAAFESTARMQWGGEEWQVVRAVPNTRALFRKTRKLTLHLGRISSVPPQEILYSLPTICDAIPGLSNEAVDGSEFTLQEDDWRQVELVSAGLSEDVEAELGKIRQVRAGLVEGAGWPEIRVRSKPRAPLACTLNLHDLVRRLGHVGDIQDLAYAGTANRIEHGFALALPGVTVYGVAPLGSVQSLALAANHPGPQGVSLAPIQALAQELDLEWIDWCRCCRSGPGSEGFKLALAALGH